MRANGEPGIENVFKKTDEAEMELEEEQTAGRVGQQGFIAPGVWASGLGATAEETKLKADIAQLKKHLVAWQIATAVAAGGFVAVTLKPQWFGLRAKGR